MNTKPENEKMHHFVPDYLNHERTVYRQFIDFIGFKMIHVNALIYSIVILQFYEFQSYFCFSLADIYKLYSNFSQVEYLLVSIIFFVGLVIGNFIYEFYLARIKISYLIDYSIILIILINIIFLLFVDNFIIAFISRLILGILTSVLKPNAGIILVELFQSKVNNLLIMIIYGTASLYSLILIIFQFLSTPNYELNRFYITLNLIAIYYIFLLFIYFLINKSFFFSEKVINHNFIRAEKIISEDFISKNEEIHNKNLVMKYIYKEINFPIVMRKFKDKQLFKAISAENNLNEEKIENNSDLDLAEFVNEENFKEESIHISALFSEQNMKYTIFNCISILCGYYTSYTYTILNNTISKLGSDLNNPPDNNNITNGNNYQNDIIIGKIMITFPPILSISIFSIFNYFEIINRKISSVIFIMITIIFQILSIVNLPNVIIYSAIANITAVLALSVTLAEIMYSYNIILQNLGSNFCYKVGRIGILVSIIVNISLSNDFKACIIISMVMNVIYLIFQIMFPERRKIH